MAIRTEVLCLETLLERNYNRIIDRECVGAVLEYVRNHEDVKRENATFIKRLTKVCLHLVRDGVLLTNSDLERIYWFNITGYKKTREDYLDGKDYVVMGSHLLAYAGDFSKELFGRTKSVRWLKRNYACRKSSGDQSKDLDKKTSSHNYSLAGDAARNLFRISDNFKDKLMWAERWYRFSRISANMVEIFNREHSTYTHGFAGDAARNLFDITRQEEWCERWYDEKKISAEMSKGFDRNHSAISYRFAGYAAAKLFGITGEDSFRIEAIDCCNKFLDYFREYPDRRKEELRIVEKKIRNLS